MPNSNKKKRPWEEEKERLLKMSQEQRRQLIKEYISLHDVPTWLKQYGDTPAEDDNEKINSLCDKVSLYRGDITQLEVDAIVNAANSSLLGGGGVDGCIHRASGPNLIAECRTLGGCPTGQAKITCGYQLPAKYVIHTVGPIARGQLSDSHKKDLESCYKSSLALATKYKIRSIAFPCISTGIYGFPNEPAACIALNTAKEWLTENKDEVDRIIFCVFLEIDEKIYSKKLSEFFPKEVEEKNVHSPPSKKSKAKKADESTNIDDSDDMDKETGHESDDASEMKKPGHESDISDEMAGLGQEQEGSMRGTVLESEGSGDMEKPHQHSEVPDGGPIKDDGGEQELSQASNLSQTDECMKEPTQEEVKTKPEDITPSQETGTDSQSESVYMDSQEPFSHTPLAKEPKVDSDSESQVMEQSIDTCDQAQSDIQDVEMNSQNTITPNDENSQLMGDSPDAREGDEK
ncbi:ADP-ribose glycohydrolase MACROD2 isoform X4 [Pyxicephalus adspersus]|uniref:ADP-ribose glycohydrolase MACROD2 isoform X4 n=1 Tax=Pyxicephalus adspersus TaxID=30357 RepID=UPI003B596ACE